VDLINVGHDATGYAEIVAVEIPFIQTTPGQSFGVRVVDLAGGIK
jgi:hypothetical protein